MTAEQCRAARRLLGWTMTRLAEEARLPQANYISIFEHTGRMMSPNRAKNIGDRVTAIRDALEAAGVEFLEQNAGGPGVRLREPPE